MRANLAAFAAGSLFAVGLVISGMTQPAKVVGFLDVTGAWDPSLAVVMAGAVLAYFPLYWRLSRRGGAPVFAAQYLIPARGSLDARLLIGAGLFGVGWGLAGFCPGPALVASGSGATAALAFTAAMLVGMLLHRGMNVALSRHRQGGAPAGEHP